MSGHKEPIPVPPGTTKPEPPPCPPLEAGRVLGYTEGPPVLHMDERAFWERSVLAALRYGPDKAVHEADWLVRQRRKRCAEHAEGEPDVPPFAAGRPSVAPHANVSPINEGVDFLPVPPVSNTRPLTEGIQLPAVSTWFITVACAALIVAGTMKACFVLIHEEVVTEVLKQEVTR